ncbi:mRNA-decapping enzyme [Emydomyces testavorans]|uniref:mRNA-decapping enzyme n=1 Tax=Emydomyces testavorans TaxID=2070801 RepID=A0AAF0DGG5_9EURO|nr:mRNA-decapping enzyme [Emydomyces testavorans]
MAEIQKSDAESLIPKFKIERLLNQDQNDRRISLFGHIDDQPGILIVERAAFVADLDALKTFHAALINVANLGANDIYRWYMASSGQNHINPPDLKLNLIWPCTEQHILKYSAQNIRMVTETPEIYQRYVRPYMQRKRENGRLNWVFNIIEGRKEQEDVLYRGSDAEEGFLLLPDLNWDRKTIGTLRLLALVERRDIWSLRDLKKSDIDWLKHMRQKILDAAVKVYPELDTDQLKLYVHYHPTYYHFHVHVVNVMLEAGITQSTGKAFGLENLISQLETMAGGPEAGMASTSLSFFLGESSELWTNIFGPLKRGEMPNSES